DEALAALGARAPLRAHGLIVVEGVPGGLPEPADAVLPAPGIAARLAGTPVSADELGCGVEVVAPPPVKPALPDPLVPVLRDHLIDVEPGWVALDGSRAGEALALAQSLAFRIKRAVVLVDGRTVGGLGAAAAWRLLAAVRRECDLTDAPLIVDGAFAVRGVL